jgi:DNA mismatch repair protein MLH1
MLKTTDLTELFANHTYVGIVDGWRRLAGIQHGVKLYLVDYGAVWYSPKLSPLQPIRTAIIAINDVLTVSYEFFYQLGLSEFGNFGTIEFVEPLYIRDLLTIAMENDEEPKEVRDEEMAVQTSPLNPLSLFHSPPFRFSFAAPAPSHSPLLIGINR